MYQMLKRLRISKIITPPQPLPKEEGRKEENKDNKNQNEINERKNKRSF